MKNRILLLFCLLIISFSASNSYAQTFDYIENWQKVSTCEENGLPRSALEIVTVIYNQARAEKNYSQFVKSLIYSMKYRSMTTDDAFIKNLTDAERIADSASFPAKPILHSMLGEMYWWYFENNRYKFYGRSTARQIEPSNVDTWDLHRLVNRVIYHYQRSIAEKEKLKQVLLNDFEDIVKFDTSFSAKLAPTLYDFLTLRAISLFSKDEPGLIRPTSEFSMNNENFLLPVDSFVRMNIQTTDTSSYKYQSIKLFQDILQAHLNDRNPETLMLIDLKRLNFINQNVSNAAKDSLYLNCLYALEKKCTHLANKNILGMLIAEKLNSMGDAYNPRISQAYKWNKKQALEKALSLQEQAPEDKNMKHFISNIERKDISVILEKENIPNEAFRAMVTYKNADSVYIRIIKTSYQEYSDFLNDYKNRNKREYHELDKEILEFFNHKSFVHQYSISLQNDHDYQKHYAEIKIPALEKGLYFIIVGTNPNMDHIKNSVSYGVTSVTNISFINRNNPNGSTDFYMLNRKTGEPLEGVKAECWTPSSDFLKSKISGTYTSDKDGFFKVAPNNSGFSLDFNWQGDHWSTRNIDQIYPNYNFYNYSDNKTRNIELKTYFFTDRAIYRPGQTIYFKGITFKTDGKKLNEITINEPVSVELKDVNDQKIAEMNLITNEFGSFSGSFTAPNKGLNGEMTIQDKNGSITISVEDYKRPKFEVTFDTLRSAYRLGEIVSLSGHTTMFSGAVVDGAEVKYRVVRQTRYSGWFPWWIPRPVSPGKVITNGTIKTKADGTFQLSFKAIPDADVAIAENPTFSYTVLADVTDINGETHSGQKNISAGYKALIVNTDIPDKVDKTKIHQYDLITHNLNDDFEAASGIITVYKLKSPDKVFRNRNWEQPDRFTMTREEYYRTFPADPYKDEWVPSAWEVEKIVQQIPFNTATEKTFKLSGLPRWKDGSYKLVVNTTDQFGEKVESTNYFSIYDSKSNNLPYPVADWFDALKCKGEPGDTAQIELGTGYDKSHILMEVEADNQILKKEWLTLKNQQKLLTCPLLEKYRGNIGLHYTFIRNNRLYTHDCTIEVPYNNKKLDISFETFRNKLLPGEKEQWRLRVKGKAGDKVTAEMVATLYDASLDAYKQNSFNAEFWPSFAPQLSWQANQCFETFNLKNYTKNYAYPVDFAYKYTKEFYGLQWFGYGYHVKLYTINAPNFKIISSVKQSGTELSGTVRNASGENLSGVTILATDKNNKTIGNLVTDMNGKFSLKTPLNEFWLLVSYIGCKSQKINLKNPGKASIMITMDEDSGILNECAVVGYGSIKKSISLRGTGFADKALQDRLAGVNISNDQKNIRNKQITATKPESEPDLSALSARTNLNETAFFFPHLQTDSNGDVLINFSIPEALTRWKMLGFAHTKELAYGFTQNELTTRKDLMITPNVPRFFREGDSLTLTAKVSGLIDKELKGTAQLMLFDAMTMKPVDEPMNNNKPQLPFTVKKGESANLNWNITIPVGLQAVTCRIVAKAGNYSDGEESSLPVLSNSTLVTETLPIQVKGQETKIFTLDKLLHNTSSTIQNHKLTLEYTSNPAWYAIQALPYLMEYPYECAEQTFSRFYANSIASYIANSSPKIKQVFDTWKNISPDALLSNLEKNQELKGVMLEETPWILSAKNESQCKQRIALLFDLNHMSKELDNTFEKLKKMQSPGGAWPWFSGGQEDRYITQHIICGLGKLDHLGIKTIRNDNNTWEMVKQAIAYTDEKLTDDYIALKRLANAGKINLSDNHSGYSQIHYLYARSFFNDLTTKPETQEALGYYLGQARKYWLSNNFYMQGMIALALKRYNDQIVPVKIIKSLKEHAIFSKELGMYFTHENGWCWYQAPVETQAMMIEAFDEVIHDSAAINEMKLWLLKQKQTQNWKTTKATVEACYALLLRGSDWLSSEPDIDITIGNQKINPTTMPEFKTEAGTGYFKTSWNKNEITPDMGKVIVTKNTNGVSWGAIYWQYFEQLDKIKTADNPLKLKKQLFIVNNTASGQVISPISDTTRLYPGNLLKIHIELQVDRSMEYVHMKDMHAAGLEPVNVLSQYKYQDGLGYYESTRDAATNFFFGWLPKGTYVFEYPLRVTHAGDFSNGITTIQCMYAPEFTSHSEGVRLKVMERKN